MMTLIKLLIFLSHSIPTSSVTFSRYTSENWLLMEGRLNSRRRGTYTTNLRSLGQNWSTSLLAQFGSLTGELQHRFVVRILDVFDSSPNTYIYSRGKLFPEIRRPLLFFESGNIILDFSRRPLTGTQSSPETLVSRLSQTQTEALKEIERLASEDQLILDSQLGDMIFVNNHSLLHSRDEFRDDSEHSRHMVRMWLRNADLAWVLPKPLAQGNHRIYWENELRERWAVSVSSSLASSIAQSQCVDTDLSH
jgi:hypothetical protein